MRTRTLLLLAVSCGLVILIAGGLQLLRLSNGDQGTPTIEFGVVGQAGDARIVVSDVDDRGDELAVTVQLSGVDDPDGLEGFTLVAPGVVLVVGANRSGTCTAFTEAATICTLVFDTSSLDAGTRVLLFRRADTQLRWALTRV